MPLAFIYPIQPGAGGTPENPITLPPGIWPSPPEFGGGGEVWPKPPGYGGGYPSPGPIFPGYPKPPGIWGPGSGFPTNPIYIPPLGWVNVPTFPALPIVIPPPGTINKPGYPANPIVVPPMPDIDIPEGSALILVITDDGCAWKLVAKSEVKPVPVPEPKK